MARSNRSELSEQIEVVKRLRLARLLYCHVPNGGKRGRREEVLLKAAGTVAGVPDLLIFDEPPASPWQVGCALEMKREGARPSRVSAVQRQWLAELSERNWLCIVGYGAQDALVKLREAGYGV